MIDMAPPQRINVLAVGWYGAPNVGDEVLLAVLKRRIDELGGELMIVSADPALSHRMHGVNAVNFNNLGEIAGALQWANVLVMGGGGIFQDHHPFRLPAAYDPALNDISAYARPVLMARQFGVPVVIWGHGVGPLRTTEARDLVRDIFTAAVAVSVRDEESLRLLREIGVSRSVEVGPDPGWLYASHAALVPADLSLLSTTHDKILAIVIREWERDPDWKAKLIIALRSVSPEGWNVVWIAFQADTSGSGAASDLPVVEALREQVPEWAKGRVEKPVTPAEAWDLLSTADSIVSMRLHASILGLSAGKPVMGIEYDEKLSRAHAMAGMPGVLRLALDSSPDRYVEALAAVLDSDNVWKPDDDLVGSLEHAAAIHLELLAPLGSWAETPKSWNSGEFDWIGAWLQHALAELRMTRETNQRAHDLLSYRDAMLAERDVHLRENHARITALEEERRLSALLHEQGRDMLGALQKSIDERVGDKERLCNWLQGEMDIMEKKLQERSDEIAALSGQLQEQAHVREEKQKLAAKLSEQAGELVELTRKLQEHGLVKAERDQLADQLREQSTEMATLGRQVYSLQIRLDEQLDEIEKRDSYIEEKEIYIAKLLQHVDQLAGDLAEIRAELAEARRSRLGALIGVVRRDAVRMIAAPFKLAMVWRRHGVRVAAQQGLRRMATLGHGFLEETSSAVAPSSLMVKPVRGERLLVIAERLFREGGWPGRAVSLAMAAERAGYFVRIWDCTMDNNHDESRLVHLLTSADGLLREVEGSNTRVLLASASQAALDIAAAAAERNGEVIVDLASIDMVSLGPERRQALLSIARRGVFRDEAEGRLWDKEVSRLDDAADNERFDSYKTYPLPAEYRKRRGNMLVVVEDVDGRELMASLSQAFPEDQILVAGCDVDRNARIAAISLLQSNLPSLLAAARCVLVSNGGKSLSPSLCDLIRAALLLERPVICDASDGLPASANLHRLGRTSWAEAVAVAKPREDYRYVSRNCWLGRVEELVRAEFPASVSAIVLIHNNRPIIERCISTILHHCGAWLREIVVVDNQSSDGGAELVEQLYAGHPKVKLLRNSENGCSSGRNLGVQASSGEYIAFFDSDQWLTAPSCFAEAIHVLEHGSRVGAIGWNAGWFDATRSDLGGAISDYVPMRGMNAAALAKGYREDIGFLGTSGMFMRRDLFDQIDGFDTFYDPTCFEDTDLCFQIKKAGYSVVLRDLAGIRHQPHQTTGASAGSDRYMKLFQRNSEYFRKKWSGHPDFFVDYSA